jgi:predicted kinase
MPRCYQLIGIPGSGKSTWATSQEWFPTCEYISTDKFVEAFARDTGRTYSEVFAEIMPTAVRLMAEEVVAARDAGKDIIWDQTSTTIASRTRKFNMLPDYEHIAVVFETPNRIELKQRLASRPGKEIPEVVIEGMLASFEMPTEEEGFKEIWYTY